MLLDTVLPLVLGLVLLTVGAEALVRGASRLAEAVGISPLVVGLTVVAYGTSAPELAVSVQASLAGQGDIAVGNVVGSNIFNVLFILGLSALVTPLVVDRQLVQREVPLMVGVSVLLLLMALDGALGRVEGLLLVAGAVGYTWFTVRESRREGQAALAARGPDAPAAQRPGAGHLLVQVAFMLAGLAMLVFGARLLVEGAVAIARAFGVSELVIGLTIVAAGTSLPEVATSVMAAIRGQRDIAVGNVVGSNVFNILLILGVAGTIAPDGLAVAPSVRAFDLPVMVAVAVGCLPVFFTGHLIARWEGALFLAFYAAYLTLVVLAATGSAARGTFGTAMLWLVLPITAVTLLVLAWREWRARHRAGAARA